MKAIPCKVLTVISILIGAAARSEAHQSSLSTDKPVYTVGGIDPVEITLVHNGLPSSASLSWSIKFGSRTVLKAPKGILGPLAPGEKRTWKWNKKNSFGKSVKSGTYTVVVSDGSQINAALMIALTPSGRIAGASWFPLMAGNRWTYDHASSDGLGPQQSMKVLTKNIDSDWYLVENLAGIYGWAHMAGGALPILYAGSPASFATAHPLFRFEQPLKYAYPLSFPAFPPGSIMRVKAVNQSVVTPAGTFHGCYRLDVQPPGSLWATMKFYFAPGIGLVQYERFQTFEFVIHRLHQATLRGTDGVWYTIGRN